MKPGNYDAVVTDQVWTTSQAGTPGLALTCDVLDSFGGVESMVGTIWFSTRSEKGMEMALQQLVHLGFNPKKQKLADIGNGISFVDRRCQVKLEENEYPAGSGKKSIKIAKFGGPPKPPTSDQLAELDAILDRVKGSVGTDDAADADEFDRANPVPPAPPPTPTPAPPATDAESCPF